jgi:Arc/MetJ-type ribon-helix-helix transcriptional regulator
MHKVMRKTTVYLNEDEADGLRSLAAATGESQAELIREGVRRLLRGGPERKFRSMGKGASAGEPRPRWNADELGEKILGRR